jgi:lipopolysaccharide biosynthesis glycosyltransferase
MKNKIIIYASDDIFFEYARASFASFCKHHSLSEWRIIFADVGLQPWQQAELARFGEIIAYEPYRLKQQHDVIYSAACARIKMLADFVNDESVLLYLDSDTLIFENLDKLMVEFVDSEKPIAIGIEDIEEFWRVPVSYAWREGKIPEEFKNQDKWRNAPMANAGVLLAQGAVARELGEIGMRMCAQYGAQLWLPEQAVIDTLLYDREIPYMKLPPRYNCLAWEKHISHVGEGPKYVGTRPYFRGESVAIRHFAGPECKVDLKAALAIR